MERIAYFIAKITQLNQLIRVSKLSLNENGWLDWDEG